MKKFTLKTLLAVAGMFMATSAWAEGVVVPTPVYFNDFSFATSGSDGIEIVGNGVFEDDADARFGKVFHNDLTNTSAIRTNYLKLPSTVFSSFTTENDKKEMSIGFWVNKKSENDFFYTPLFAAYGAEPKETVNTWPMFVCETRGLIQLNCAGYCDFGIYDASAGTTYNDGTPYVTSAWLDDAQWHYYTVVLTTTTAKVYVDGELKNGWTVDGTSEGQVISGLLKNAATNLTYVTLGGNQAWNWADADPAFGFDDFAVYDKALTKEQIDQIRANKLNRTTTGIAIGAIDNSTDYLAATSDKITLKPGESYHYNFINYNNGSTNHNNWILPIYDASDNRVIAVRADNWEDKGWNGTGCTSVIDWTNFPGEMNGATVDMYVTFTSEKVVKMASTITTASGLTWTYSYTNDYTESTIDLTSNASIKVALSVSRSWLDLLKEERIVNKHVSAAGWATICSEYPLDFSTAITNLQAYAITGQTGTTLTLEEVSKAVDANEGILLNAAEGDYRIPVAATGTAVSGNKLQGNLTATSKDANSIYVLMAGEKGVGFYKNNNAFTVGANTAYLNVSDFAGAPTFLSFFDSETTGIESVKQNTAAFGTFFDMQGRRVAKPAKGLYIIGGKKVVIR